MSRKLVPVLLFIALTLPLSAQPPRSSSPDSLLARIIQKIRIVLDMPVISVPNP
jgi:hypothetical protein